jgi:hypothetical protein
MTRISFLFIFLLSVLPAEAQERISGRVTDVTTGDGLSFASLKVLGRAEGGVTDLDGDFAFGVSHLPARIIVSSIGYRSDTLLIDSYDFVAITLQAVTSNLPQIEVVSDRQWSMLKRPKVLAQYLTLCRDRLFVLGRRGRRSYLTIYSPRGDMLLERELKIPNITGLETNCFGQLHLLTSDYAIRMDNGKLLPLEKMPMSDYQQLFQDCQYSNDESLFLERSDFEGFRKLYLSGNRATGELLLFKSILFKEKMQGFRRSTPRLDYLTSVQNNMGDIYQAENKRIRRSQGAADFEKAIIQKNHTHNALFFRDEVLTLFNFDEDVIETFSATGDSLTTVPILFNSDRKGSDAVMRQDPMTGKYYSISRLPPGYVLTEIDESTGQGVRDIALEIADYRQLAILGGRVYIVGVPLKKRESVEYELIWMDVSE